MLRASPPPRGGRPLCSRGKSNSGASGLPDTLACPAASLLEGEHCCVEGVYSHQPEIRTPRQPLRRPVHARALPPGGPLHRQDAGQLRRARGFSPRAAGPDAGPGRGARRKVRALMFVPWRASSTHVFPDLHKPRPQCANLLYNERSKIERLKHPATSVQMRGLKNKRQCNSPRHPARQYEVNDP